MGFIKNTEKCIKVYNTHRRTHARTRKHTHTHSVWENNIAYIYMLLHITYSHVLIKQTQFL